MRFCNSSTTGLGFNRASSLVGVSEAATSSTGPVHSFASLSSGALSRGVVGFTSTRLGEPSKGESGVLVLLDLRFLFCDLEGTITGGAPGTMRVTAGVVAAMEQRRGVAEVQSVQRSSRGLRVENSRFPRMEG